MTTAAVILAAGGSTRLGRPKQLVPHRGSTLIREAAACALRACDAVAVVLGAHADEVAAALDGLPIELIANFAWREGMASSIRCGAHWADRVGARALALLVCDQPRLTVAHLAALVTMQRDTRRTTASRYAGRLGVPAVFGRACFGELGALVGDVGARAVLAADPTVVAIDWPDGELDVDEPAQLAYAAPDRIASPA